MASTAEKVPGEAPTGRIAKDLPWVHAARHICERTMARMTDAECLTVELPLEEALASVFERLDGYEKPDAELVLPPSVAKLATHARLYAAALSYVDMLYARTQRPSPRGEALLQRGIALRDTLRGEVQALLDDKLLAEDARTPQRRGASPQSVGLELLELVKFGDVTQTFCSPEEWKMSLTMFDAQLAGERLLTSVGQYDAPPLVRKIRADRRRAYTLFVRTWSELRALAISELGEEQGSRIAPPLG